MMNVDVKFHKDWKQEDIVSKVSSVINHQITGEWRPEITNKTGPTWKVDQGNDWWITFGDPGKFSLCHRYGRAEAFLDAFEYLFR